MSDILIGNIEQLVNQRGFGSKKNMVIMGGGNELHN